MIIRRPGSSFSDLEPFSSSKCLSLSLVSGAILEVLYGHKVISDNDAHMELVDRSVRLAGELGNIGTTIIDLLPFRAYSPFS